MRPLLLRKISIPRLVIVVLPLTPICHCEPVRKLARQSVLLYLNPPATLLRYFRLAAKWADTQYAPSSPRLPIRFRRHVRRKRNHSAGMGSLHDLPPGSTARGKSCKKIAQNPIDFERNSFDKAAHPPLDKRTPWALLCQAATPGQPRGTPAQLLNAAAFRP